MAPICEPASLDPAQLDDSTFAPVVPFTPVFDEAADRGRPLMVLRPENAAAKVMRDLAAQLTVLAPAGR